MLAAGHETTAVALFWCCYILAPLPAAQQRIAAEAGALDLGPAGAPPPRCRGCLIPAP